MKSTRRLVPIIATAALVSGCGGPAIWHAEARPPTLTITAGTGRSVPITTEIGTTVAGGQISEVALVDGTGARVDGAFRVDGSAWVPDRALSYGQQYSVRVTATSDSGRATTKSTRFTTMAKPGQATLTTLNVANGETYGVGMPVTIGFDPGVPPSARDDVERRLFVVTQPPQPGVWSWLPDGTRVTYRAPEYWKPGTRLTVRSALGGLPLSGNQYGDVDRVASAVIASDKIAIDIDNATKQMSVFSDDKLVRKIPVSLGKSSTPSSSGHMVIMEKFATTVFDTTGSPDPYVVTVQDAQRLTNGGEFIHSAPWSVGEQGYANVTHGCTNVSPESARWLMDITHVGDPVTVTGTEVTLDQGNGWTAWNVTWDQFLAGSMLKKSAELKPPSAGKAVMGAAPTGEPSNRGR